MTTSDAELLLGLAAWLDRRPQAMVLGDEGSAMESGQASAILRRIAAEPGLHHRESRPARSRAGRERAHDDVGDGSARKVGPMNEEIELRRAVLQMREHARQVLELGLTCSRNGDRAEAPGTAADLGVAVETALQAAHAYHRTAEVLAAAASDLLLASERLKDRKP